MPETIYTGIRAINASDFNAQLSFIEQSRKGSFLLKNLFISEPHTAFFVHPLYYFLTLPFRNSTLLNATIYHITRVVMGFALLMMLFRMISVFEKDKRTRIFAYFLLVFTSGAGILLRKFLFNLSDLEMTDTITFLTLGEAPHAVADLLLLWGGITSIFLVLKTGSLKPLWIFFPALTILWWDHPFDAVSLGAVMAVNLWRLPLRRMIPVALGCLFVTIPAVLYYRELMVHPGFLGFGMSGNTMLTPPLPSLLSGFLPLVVLSGFGIVGLVKRKEYLLLSFLLLWILAQFVLVYLPFSVQRRMIMGVQFPLALLAAIGMSRFLRTWIAVLLILLCTATNVFVMAQTIQISQSRKMPFYMPLSYKKAFDWMRTQEPGPVLSSLIVGNFVAAYSGLPSYMGHLSLTPNVLERRDMAASFYRKPTYQFLQERNIRYIFLGPDERGIASPEFPKLFKKSYDADGVTIFSVRPPD